MKDRRSRLLTIGITALVTAAVTTFTRNFISGEKKIKRRVAQCYAIDDLWTSVGSANFDNRSFRLNDEANLNVIDREIAAVETRAFEEDKARAREVSYRDWLNRPAWQRVTDAGAALLRSQL